MPLDVRATGRALRRPSHRDRESQLKPETPGPQFPWRGLLILATAVFISMSTEFLRGALLPNIAQTFDRPITDVGQLITVFAGAVIVSTTPLAILTRRMPRKRLAIVALAGFAAAMTLTASAPTFEVLLLARAAGGVAHGLFWSVAAVYAADLVPRSQLGRASAITAAGGSAAGVLGVPLGNALGQAFGWRMAFSTLAAVAVLAGILVALLLPSMSANSSPAHRTSSQHSPLGRQVGASCSYARSSCWS